MSTFRQLLTEVEKTCNFYIGNVNHNTYNDIKSSLEEKLEKAGIILPPEIEIDKGSVKVDTGINNILEKDIIVAYHVDFEYDEESRNRRSITGNGKVLNIEVLPQILDEYFDYELNDIVQIIRYSHIKSAHTRILDIIQKLKEQMEICEGDVIRLEKIFEDQKLDKNIFIDRRLVSLL